MGFTLEERIGITMENVKTLSEIAETTGVCITEYDSLESYTYDFLESLSTETLQAITGGRINGLTNKMIYAAGIVLKYRQ